MQITFTKSEFDGACEWAIEVDGRDIGRIDRECEDYAHATSRARGTKVVGYSVGFDHTSDANGWFPANGNARQALAQAKAYAAKVAASMVNA